MLKRTIRSYIRFYSILLVAVPIVVIAAIAMLLFRGLVLDKELGRLEQHVSYQHSFVENWLQGIRQDVAFLAGEPALRESDEKGMRAVFERYLAGHVDVPSAVRINAEGVTTVDTTSPGGLYLGDRGYFKAGSEGKPWISDVIIGRTSGKPIIIFSHPVQTMDARFGGVVFLPVEMPTVQAFLNTISGVENGESYLVNREGEMLTESRYLSELQKKGLDKPTAVTNLKISTRLFAAALKNEPILKPYTGYHGVEVIGSYSWVNGGRWLLVTEVPFAAVMRNFYQLLWLVLGIIFFSLILLTPVLLRFSRSIEEPINGIVVFAENMARGEYDQECSLPDVEGAPEEVVLLYNAFCDMNEKVVATIEELERSVIVDPLTGVFNRRHLMTEGERVVDQCQRSRMPCACLMLDIDHFKAVNDTYGHAVGDMVLVDVARIIGEAVRKSDIVARYGGEEFAVIAPNTDREHGIKLAERIRLAVEAMEYQADTVRFFCTVSIGVSDIETEMLRGATLLEGALNCADQQLYRAKREGRNRVVGRAEC